MKLVRILIWLVTSALLTACNLLQSKEEQCLQSIRLQLNDPDSAKLVQNLGDRGEVDMAVVWIRYSATNAFGARVSTNMACVMSGGKWVRGDTVEMLSVLWAKVAALRRGLSSAEAEAEAKVLVFDGVGPIPDPLGLRSPKPRDHPAP